MNPPHPSKPEKEKGMEKRARKEANRIALVAAILHDRTTYSAALAADVRITLLRVMKAEAKKREREILAVVLAHACCETACSYCEDIHQIVRQIRNLTPKGRKAS